MQLITTYAMKAGFGGGLVVDYPNSSRAKKYVCVRSHGAKGYFEAHKHSFPIAVGFFCAFLPV